MTKRAMIERPWKLKWFGVETEEPDIKKFRFEWGSATRGLQRNNFKHGIKNRVRE